MKTILATGGFGFVGSHTCISLLNEGFKIIVIDSLINSTYGIYKKISKIKGELNLEENNKFTFVKGDMRDITFLENVFKEAKMRDQPINSVIHFAGLKSVNQSIIKPLQYWDSNVNGTINLLKTMRKYNCYDIVFSSSATVYKPKLNKVLDENSEIGPINPYGRTKLANEQILTDTFLSEPNKWRISLLRYFNPVGAHSSGLIGELPIGMPNNLFPIIMNVAIGKLDFLSIYGNDWPTEDGTCIRDYIHVMDLADAHVEALKYIEKSGSGINTLNIGTGIGKSVLEVVETFKDVSKCQLPFKFSERREGDAPFVVADNRLAKKILNWQPKRNLYDICKDGWNFIKNNPTL